MIFRCFALVALLPAAGCTLTPDYVPKSVDLPAPEGTAEVAELSPAASDPGGAVGGEAEGGGAAEVPASTEAPEMVDVPLAPSTPSSSGGMASEPSSSGGTSDPPSGAGGSVNEPPNPDGMQGGDDEPPVDDGDPTPPDVDDDPCGAGSQDPACRPPTCSDGARNQDELGSDCGGSVCQPCLCTFGTPELLGDPNYAGNLLFSPTLSPNGLTLYFGLYVQGATETVGFSTRPNVNEPFGLGNLLPAPVNTSVEGTPRIAADNVTLYFYSEREGGLGGRDLYIARRPAPGTDWQTVTPLTELNSTAADHLPWVSADQRSMYFSSDRSGNLDLYRTARASVAAAWGAPEPVTELNAASLENGATLSADEREIIFVSDRNAAGGDFFRALRGPGQTTFGAPEYLPAISSDAVDSDPALSPDGRELYFASARDGTDSRLWRVSRTCP